MYRRIAIDLSIRGHWLHSNMEYLGWWVDLLTMAHWCDTKVLVGTTLVEMKRGQVLASVPYLCKAWGKSNHNVINYLNMLEGDGMITRRLIKGKIAVIEICNYDRYQYGGAKNDAKNAAQVKTECNYIDNQQVETVAAEKTAQHCFQNLHNTLHSTMHRSNSDVTTVETNELQQHQGQQLHSTLHRKLHSTLHTNIEYNNSLYLDKKSTIVKNEKNKLPQGVAHVRDLGDGEQVDDYTAPTLEEVRAYMQINAMNADPETFHNYYTALDWRVGQTRIRDWRAMARKWASTNNRNIKVRPTAAATTTRKQKEEISKNFDDLWK